MLWMDLLVVLIDQNWLLKKWKKNIKTEMNHQMKQKKAIEDKVKVFCKGGNNKWNLFCFKIVPAMSIKSSREWAL